MIIPNISEIVLDEIDYKVDYLRKKISKDKSNILKYKKLFEVTLINECHNNSLGIEDIVKKNSRNFRRDLKNLKNAWLYLNTYSIDDVNENFFYVCREVNSRVIGKQTDYRTSDVEFNQELFKDREFSPPIWEKVTDYMQTLQEELIKAKPSKKAYFQSIRNKKKIHLDNIHPVEYSAYSHQELLSIHPFEDGNGRLSRLISNFYLKNYNMPCVNIDRSERVLYFDLLYEGNKAFYTRDLEKGKMFYEFIASKVNLALDKCLKHKF
jgi:hypothetical protein